MQYMGSKARISKQILPIILRDRKPDQWYVEPFVGGGGTIDKVEGNRIGADLNPYVIQALKAIRDEVYNLPKNNKEFTEDEYKQLRKSDKYKYKGFAGFAYSFGGKWLGGWSRNHRNDDYISRAYRQAIKQSPKLRGVKLINCSYQELAIPENSIIYCDPPYEGTTAYKDNFNHADFWKWCRGKAKEGHKVFISEYKAPSDFVCVWERSIINNLNNSKATEKLFIHIEQEF